MLPELEPTSCLPFANSNGMRGWEWGGERACLELRSAFVPPRDKVVRCNAWLSPRYMHVPRQRVAKDKTRLPAWACDRGVLFITHQEDLSTGVLQGRLPSAGPGTGGGRGQRDHRVRDRVCTVMSDNFFAAFANAVHNVGIICAHR